MAIHFFFSGEASAEMKSVLPAFQSLNDPAAGHCNLPPAEKNDAQKQKCFAERLNDIIKENKKNASAGACMMGVRTAIEKATGKNQIPWCNKASDAGNCLKALGMGVAYSADDKNKSSPTPPRPELVRDGKDWKAEWKDNKYNKVNFKSPDGSDMIPDRPTKLPIGTIIVYGGTNEDTGHIEVVTDDGEKPLCSDYCASTPRCNQTGDRWIIGIYLPPPEDGCKLPNWAKTK